MSFLSDFQRRKFDERLANSNAPREALLAAVDDIDGGLAARHAIVVLVEDRGDNTDGIIIMQAGPLSELAVEGALLRAIRVQQDKE